MRLSQFEKKVRRRNLIEYTAGLLVIGGFGWVAWLAADAGESLVAASWLTLIVGNLVVMFNLHRFASNQSRSPEDSCHNHLRSQMVSQRDALRSVAKWYIGPLVPGLLLALIAMILVVAEKASLGVAIAGLMGPALVCAAIFGGVIWLNRRAANMLSAKIADLDELADPA
jgi:hypothetical protein